MNVEAFIIGGVVGMLCGAYFANWYLFSTGWLFLFIGMALWLRRK